MSDEPGYLDNERLLHLYAQAFWHEEAIIVGNRAGLMALANAILATVEDGNGVEQFEVFTADGEGYAVRVRLMDAAGMDKLILPYTDEDARGKDGELP